MPRSRVLSFMSQWGAPPRSPADSRSQTPDPFVTKTQPRKPTPIDTAIASASHKHSDARDSPSPTVQQRFRSDSRSGRTSRPLSMIQNFQPPLMDLAHDTLPELQPIFTFLNSHSNKLYQEGYFLKLHDLDSRGRPSADRAWTECFAQLVGTVLSLWDAAALDAAGEDGEVLPTFINISDASVKMIESLPMNGSAGGQLQNVLSISTAANNRYLLHFNSLNSLTQWTAGMRLAMYEHATLQEAYTGSLIAGKGKMLNNIRTIMERSRFKTEDWARVRFGAGTPWRRCWCVISPPDEKEYHKAQKTLKKRDAYDRKVQVPKGDIKFYDTRRVGKKTRPIATVTDAYAAYAIYPQSKPLIDQSTLVKLEGRMTIHGVTDTSTEGFLFVMPEVHPAVSGFEMMLRWLFPVYDTFGIYGRPSRLIADSLDMRGLMFAMPRNRRYGYLDILDVSGLIHTKGSQSWSEHEWRTEMKKLTSQRMSTAEDTPPQTRGRRNTLAGRNSLNLNHGAVRFSDDSSSSSPSRRGSPEGSIRFAPPRRVETMPTGNGSPGRGHIRSASEALGYKRFQSETPSRLSYEYEAVPPEPPAHGSALMTERKFPAVLERVPSERETPTIGVEPAFEELKLRSASPPSMSVASPPKLVHGPNARPANKPYVTPELRRANSEMDAATLQQLAEATGPTRYTEDDQDFNHANDYREVASVATSSQRSHADTSLHHEGTVNLTPGHPYQQARRLPAIPASPYVSETAPDPSTMHNEAASPPPVPKHVQLDQAGRPTDASTSSPSPAAQSISRKPLSNTSGTEDSQPRPQSMALSTTSSNESLRDQLLEQAYLEQMLQYSPERATRISSPPGTIPDDDSVDYSSVKSLSPPKRKPVERARAGRMKTVGNPDFKPQVDRNRIENQKIEVPDIDFGPTLSYKPNARPSTSEDLLPVTPQEGAENVQRPSARLTLMEGKRASYFEGRKTSGGEENRRSVAWQPATTPNETSGRSLTPEQWVQYRAAMAAAPMTQPRATPVFGHSRDQSNATRLTSSKTPPLKTPPLSRPVSGDWTQQLNRLSLSRTHSGDWSQQVNPVSLSKTPPPLSRTPSGDWSQQIISRPHSRNASAYLNPPSPGRTLQTTQPRVLSAREQTHVARATGTSLLSLSQNDFKKSDDANAPGLIGEMAARERDRMAKHDSMRNTAVQQAIAARQQQAQAELEARMHAQYQAQYQAQEQAQQQAQLHAQMQARQLAQQQAQMQAQLYAQQQAQQQAYLYQQQQQQQQQTFQNPMNAQQVNYSYGARPGVVQQRSSQYLEQGQPGNQGFGRPGGWSNAGSPQPQAYAASYFGPSEGQHTRQQRRYQ